MILRDQAMDALEQELDRLCWEFQVRQQPAGVPAAPGSTALTFSTGL